ncbi:MAG TPA: FIST N-terminal domain-containing protein [Candidatus Limnocylindria bacterium]|nr:FIST N-terminal domain-containing protein [Candidatus Limnocylindria bacterium]
MHWGSAVSGHEDLSEAVHEACAAVRAELGGARPDLVVAFVSHHHGANYERVPELLAAELPHGVSLGCSAGGVIGGGHEVEDAPGFSVTAALLPDVRLTPLAGMEPVPPPLPGTPPQLVLLADPFTLDVEALLHAIDTRYGDAVVVGGLASGGRRPGENALYLDSRVQRGGFVGVAFDGNVQVDTIVAQGCRPIGEPMFVTRGERNVIYELDGNPAVLALQRVLDQLSKEDRVLVRQALFVGVVMRERQQHYGQGDFLIRNVLGVEPRQAALVVGTQVRENQVVQFHLRDAKTSADDLIHLLARYREEPAGSLLFSCLGRGRHLYGRPDHDTDVFRAALGDVALGGFFCNGEIGPVQGRTFLHGYTSAFGLFRPRR